MKKCPNCNATYPDDSAFCENCGSALEVAAPVETPMTPVEPPVTPEKKGGGAKIAIIIVAVILVLALAGVGVWYFFLRDDTTSDNDAGNSVSDEDDDDDEDESDKDNNIADGEDSKVDDETTTKKNDADEETTKPVDEVTTEKTTEEITTQQTVVTPPAAEECGLDVVLAYAYDGYDRIVVENVSDKPILDFEVAFVAFDKNGLPTESTYSTGNKTAANIMPGEKMLVSYYGNSNDVYVGATVAKVTYQGDETWERTDLKDWYNTVKSSFTVDAYNQAVASFATDAAKAETNEYVSIDSTDKVDRNSYSEKDDFDFTLTNISDKDIAKVTIRVLEYDENGYAVSTYPYDTYCMNDYSTGGTVNLVSGATNTYTSGLFFVGTCKQYKCIVQSVEFTDGETWENPYMYEWIFVNNKTFN